MVIPSESVRLIYYCHALWHFDFLQIDDVLEEWNMVLIPNGILRISVPDSEKVINL